MQSDYTPDTVIVVDNEQYVSDSKKHRDNMKRFRSAVLAGKKPTLVSDCHGTSSVNVTLTCYGNQPGKNCPQKCLQSNIAKLELLDAQGAWKRLVAHDGLSATPTSVEVLANSPIYLRGRFDNVGETTWRARKNLSSVRGAIRIAGNENRGTIKFRLDLQSDVSPEGEVVLPKTQVSAGISSPSTMCVQMVAEERAWFGDIVCITLTPRAAPSP